jgi:hypothetical protein
LPPISPFIHNAEHNKNWSLHPLTTDKELFRFYGSSYVFRSIYHDQLWRWLQLFPREQIKIIQTEYFMSQREGMEPYRSFDEIVRREIEEVPTLLEAHQRGFLTPGNQVSAHRTLPDGTPRRVSVSRFGTL